MPIIFVVVLRMLTALGYEFDECVSMSRIRKLTHSSNSYPSAVDIRIVFRCKNFFYENFHSFKIFTSITSTIVAR
jgi:hypothetical protein